MDGYEIEKIDEGLWAIDDKMGCSMYLVEGKNKALLIDTGVQEGKILPMLKSLQINPFPWLSPMHISIICIMPMSLRKSFFMKGISRLGMGEWDYVCSWDRLCFVSSIRSTGSRSIFPLLTRLSST